MSKNCSCSNPKVDCLPCIEPFEKLPVERKTLGEKCLKQSSNNKNNQLENYFVNFFNQKSLQSFTWKTPNNLCLGVITWRVGYFCGDLSPSKSSLFFDRNLICFLQSYMNSALTAQKTIFFVVDSPQNQGRWLEKNSHLPGPSPTTPTPPRHPRSLCLTSGPFSWVCRHHLPNLENNC